MKPQFLVGDIDHPGWVGLAGGQFLQRSLVVAGLLAERKSIGRHTDRTLVWYDMLRISFKREQRASYGNDPAKCIYVQHQDSWSLRHHRRTTSIKTAGNFPVWWWHPGSKEADVYPCPGKKFAPLQIGEDNNHDRINHDMPFEEQLRVPIAVLQVGHQRLGVFGTRAEGIQEQYVLIILYFPKRV